MKNNELIDLMLSLSQKTNQNKSKVILETLFQDYGLELTSPAPDWITDIFKNLCEEKETESITITDTNMFYRYCEMLYELRDILKIEGTDDGYYSTFIFPSINLIATIQSTKPKYKISFMK